MKPTIRVIEGETEKFCHQCQEWWPATDEFFYRSTRKTLRSPCKACIAEHRQKVWKTKTCCVPGCTQPRYHWRYARCRDHATWRVSK